MSNNMMTPKEAVERYYKIYQEYEEAFNKNKKPKNEVLEELKKNLDRNNPNEREFKDFAKEQYIGESQKSMDVQLAANKFVMAVNFYNHISENDLDEALYEDYKKLKNMVYKPLYSVEGGKMVRNENIDENTIDFEAIYNELKQRFQNE